VLAAGAAGGAVADVAGAGVSSAHETVGAGVDDRDPQRAAATQSDSTMRHQYRASGLIEAVPFLIPQSRWHAEGGPLDEGALR
jgi:hypothetical protein